MAQRWRRWRAPLLGGIAIWLMSFPLFLSHPAAAVSATASSSRAARAVEAGDHAVFAQLARRQQLAVASSSMVAAITPQPTDPVVTVPRAVAAVAVAPARPAAPPALAAPAVRANNIVIRRLGVNLPVGWYSDCLGRAAVPRWGAWRWSCAGAGNTYIMAHNPGTFTPILGLRAGDIIEYGDPAGRVHTYRVSFTTIVSNTQLWPLGATGVATLTLQTCWTWDGSRDFIVRAVAV